MKLKETLALRTFGLFKIPLLFYVGPSILKLSDKACEVKIPLSYRTKNHLGCMYFGVLAAGADCAGGLMGMQAIKKSGKKVDLLFKDFKAEFLRRAEGDVHFKCLDGALIKKQVADTIRSGKRVNRTMKIVATTPKVSGNEPVALFELTLSVKSREVKKKPASRKAKGARARKTPRAVTSSKAKRSPRKKAA